MNSHDLAGLNATGCTRTRAEARSQSIPPWRTVLKGVLLGALITASAAAAPPQAVNPASRNSSAVQTIPNTGQQITPLAPRAARFDTLNPGLADFPNYVAGQAVTTVTSPDRKTLLILTSGYNLLNATSGSKIGSQIAADSNEYVFVYDITRPLPVKKQVIQVPNTYNGIVFDPTGTTFYVSGGVNDNVHVFALGQSGLWAEQAGSPIALGHSAGVGLSVKPAAAGIGITKDGSKLVVADYYNDSISILNKTSNGWTKLAELDLRPGKIDPKNSGVPGGEYPFWVSVRGNDTAYISSIRDREVVVVNFAGTPTVVSRIKLKGQPNKMVLNAAQTTLYVAQDETDSVAVIDTASNTVREDIAVGTPDGLLPSSRAGYTGSNTNSVTLSPDEQTLYVTNGNMNDVAVVELNGGSGAIRTIGLIPTGWYPNSISFSADGRYAYVVNGKSPTGPNPGNCNGAGNTEKSDACAGTNQYDLQLIKAGFQAFPTPAASQLSTLTQQVALNNHFSRTVSAADQATMAFLRSNIKHVIYIIKENRTYDQVLGDLPVGNGDPSLTEFGEGTTPNLHKLAQNFVTLDNFYDTSEVSMDGWPWSTSARAPDVVERQTKVNYAGRGLTNDSEGTNRNVNTGYGTTAERLAVNPLTPNDPDVLPGGTDTAAPDGPNDEENTGYLWNDALRAGLSLRNYGFFIDLARYNLPAQYASATIPDLTDPAASNTTVAYSTSAALRPYTDPYFRGFDNAFPDYYRFTEWQREFDTKYANGGLPQLSLVRFMHDHTGNFSTAINGVNTPELQEADNDYAVGLLVQKIANSQYRNNTLVFVIEDDSQDGADHVDSHRSVAFIVGPYVKQNAVVSTSYNTIDFLRTMEDILGLSPLNLNDSTAVPMADVFDPSQTKWTFSAAPSPMLYGTSLPLPQQSAKMRVPKPAHDAAYWAAATKGMDFSVEDHFDFNRYNHILWQGIMGAQPYPESHSGLDLRANRTKLLSRYRLQTAAALTKTNAAPAQRASN